MRLLFGDCLEQMRALPEGSVDSVVTDPPYGLSFMGKKWDYDVPSVEVWTECLRVLKPGGHLLAFAGTRTQHRMAVRIEDAGFEIRDMIAWVYGSGFPKSLDVSKAIDKAAGAERIEILGVSSVTGARKGSSFDDGCKGTKRTYQNNERVENYITAPATDAARQWSGWGTALKPALEPCTLARKPLIGTVAENVLTHGTGALNIDGCRVETEDNLNGGAYAKNGGRSESHSLHSGTGMNVAGKTVGRDFVQPLGRFPANLIHDGSDEVAGLFPSQQSGSRKAGVRKGMGLHGADGDGGPAIESSSGSAARFFYCAKAAKKERGPANNHPTVKPIALMEYLCRLTTQPGGVILDPFMGSGSTGIAAANLGFRFIGVERDLAYFAIATERIYNAVFKDVPA